MQVRDIPDPQVTITAYVTPSLKNDFLSIQVSLQRRMRVPQTALAQFAISQFTDRYKNNINQLVLDLGIAP